MIPKVGRGIRGNGFSAAFDFNFARETLMKITTWLATGILIATTAFASANASEKVELDKVPQAAKTAAESRFPRGKLAEASKETVEGKTVYELILKRGKTTIDVTVTAEGVIQGIERTISVKDLPKQVADMVAKTHPAKKITKIEEVISVADNKETLEYYEVFIDVNGTVMEVQVHLNGKLRMPEKK